MAVRKSVTSMKNILLVSGALFTLNTSFISYATTTEEVEKLESRIDELERLLKKQIKIQSDQDKKLQVISIQTKKTQGGSRKLIPESARGGGVAIYGTFRPGVTYTDKKENSNTDVSDALSRVGIKGNIDINDNLQAFYHGEWRVKIETDADFGDARLGYVGFQGNWGRIGIGKHWNPHYNIIAEVIDIFNSKYSPFAYDQVGPFRTDNLVSYRYEKSGFIFDAGVQVNGDQQQDGVNHIDIGSAGAAYKGEKFYVGASYLRNDGPNNYEKTQVGIGASLSLTDALYIATTYQEIETESDLQPISIEGETIDVVVSYSINKDYTVKSAYFEYDDGIDSTSSVKHDGFNMTLERHLNKDIKVFAEVLRKSYDIGGDIDSFTLGIQYNFSTGLPF